MSERVQRIIEEFQRSEWFARFDRETISVGVGKDFPETVTVRV